MTGCGLFCDTPRDDEIKVKIQLDLQEDIGLLLIDWDVNGQKGMSGTSNADRSKIKHNDTEYWEFEKQFLEDPADTVGLTLKFIVVTEYFDPNYDFIYPEEYMMPMDEISFTADFGEIYFVTITGDNVNGYKAFLTVG